MTGFCIFRGEKSSIFLLLVVGIFSIAGCSGHGRGGTVNVVGSTSVQPFAELLAEEYLAKNPTRNVEVQGGGSTAGLQAVRTGLAHIGMCSRTLTPEESGEFKGTLIARDGLAIVVNPSNPVGNLSLSQLCDLFSGAIANWQDVGGVAGPVRPITREEGSGTRDSFVHLVMGDSHITRRALTQESNGAVRELVKGDPGAIGYMSLGMVGMELKTVRIEGIEPTADNVLAGTYNLARPFLFVTKGEISAEATHFFDFVMSEEGQDTLKREGLVRVR
ncbi:MAG TPA: phosphate ABC transporter substrate-binding protein [Candidatus Hydrogenedentes bacterium]|nr:phosphate ABC transporter substrate-binding protein [Candidatus Hydrogenedentota bacterium]